MRQSIFEVGNGPSYLLYPEDKRVEYGGGFRILKPSSLEGIQKQAQGLGQIAVEEQKPTEIENQPTVFHSQLPVMNPPISGQYGYDYYHDDRNFSNFFGLEDQQYHICMQHDPNCQICQVCKPSHQYNKSSCHLCTDRVGNIVSKKKIEQSAKRRPSSNRSHQREPQQNPIHQQPKEIPTQNPLIEKENNVQPQEKQQPEGAYQLIQEPIPPQNATVQQKIEYQRKYKDYLLRKRDLYYLAILKKLVDKIDFQRYQCTSPNQERVHAHWFGIYKPRSMQSAAGKVKYDIQSHPGYQFLKSFVFVYVYQGKYREKQSYQVNAQMFLNAFQELLVDAEHSNPTKALQKLHAESYKRMLEGKISKASLQQFLNRLTFILMAFGIDNLDQRLKNSPHDLTLQEYKRVFTMIVKPPVIKQPEIKEIIERNNSYKSSSKEKFTFKPVFPEIQELDNSPSPTLSQPLANNKKMTIREQRLLADLMERQAREQDIINYKFKAKQIPKDVRDRSLYQRLLTEQAKKSAKNREESAKNLLQNENPFSFYYRDSQKQNPIDQFKQYQAFKASEVPHYVTERRYQKMLDEKQSLKQKRLEERQSQLLRSSKFPATMGYLENYPAMKSKKQEDLPYKFQPTISREIPDFQNLHKKNTSQLQNTKQLNKTITSPQEFNLSKGNKKVAERPQSRPPEPTKRVSQSVGKQYISGSTLKYDALVELRRKQNEEKQRRLAQKEAETHQKPSQHNEVLKERLRQTMKQGPHPVQGNFVLPAQNWDQLRKSEMLKKVYEQSPMLLDRRYSRVNGMKVQIPSG